MAEPTMTVRVRDQDAEPWGYGLGRPMVRVVTIATRCPVCGGPRGEPRNLNQYEDGESYSVDVWRNACGHLDRYADVVQEAARMDEAVQ